MQDSFGRKINYLRISVTDRCNLRCNYCAPACGAKLISHSEIISFETIAEIVKIAVKEFGFNKIRLTGGEPLLRRDIVELIKMLSAISGIKDLAMTTNGTFLAQYANKLKQAGLNRVNVSLDAIDSKEFKTITRGGNIKDVFAGIEAARQTHLTPIKLNCIVSSSPDEPHAKTVQKFADQQNLEIRFIKRMNFLNGDFAKVYNGSGGDCKNCNRLRLLSDGKILPCLFSNLTFNTKKLGIRESLQQAIINKPEKGLPCKQKWMINVGG